GGVARPLVVRPGTVDEHALADADQVARPQQYVLDRLVVDEAAVGAADIAEPVAFGSEHELRVTARGLGVVEFQAVGGIAAGPNHLPGQLELLPFIDTLDDD